jgi:hypothetical protein
MAALRLTIPIFALFVAVFCGDLQAGVILLVPDELQAGLLEGSTRNSISAASAASEDGREDDSTPFVDRDPSDLEDYPDKPGTQVVPVACGSLFATWHVSGAIHLAVNLERVIFPPPISYSIGKVPIR